MTPRHVLTRPRPALVAALYGGAGLTALDGVASALAGLLLLTAAEYATHRWIFHGAERYAPRLYDAIHGAHHRLPDDPGRRIVPLTHSLPLALAAWAVLPGGALAGVLLGYLAYEAAHAVAHRRGPLPRPLRALRRHHALHHFSDAGAAFGVSSPLWDRLLGTMPRAPHPWATCGGPDEPRPETLP